MPGGRRSWTVLDDDGDVVECLRHWIVHLEQTHASPNTIRAYARHVVDFANFIAANGAGIHRFFKGTVDFAVDTVEVTKTYDGHRIYKLFLEHISQRRTTRRKDRYAGSSSRCSRSG
jgi:hypothetical protein